MQSKPILTGRMNITSQKTIIQNASTNIMKPPENLFAGGGLKLCEILELDEQPHQRGVICL